MSRSVDDVPAAHFAPANATVAHHSYRHNVMAMGKIAAESKDKELLSPSALNAIEAANGAVFRLDNGWLLPAGERQALCNQIADNLDELDAETHRLLAAIFRDAEDLAEKSRSAYRHEVQTLHRMTESIRRHLETLNKEKLSRDEAYLAQHNVSSELMIYLVRLNAFAAIQTA